MDAFDVKIARDFFKTYKIQHIDNSTFLLSNTNNKLLVKTHLIDPNDNEIHQQVLSVLDIHLSLNQRYVAPLIHFQSCQQGVRAIYRMDNKTLKDEVAERMQEKRYFQQQELWVLLSSLVDSLEYLQKKGVTYGVLSSSKIFVQQKIRLLDPSSYNLAPINTSRLSYHSPEFLQNQNPIDFNQSDVYLLGLCLLQAASLAQISNKMTQQHQNQLIDQVASRYSTEIVHVLKYLLRKNPEERPTFNNIQQYIETQIQIKSQKYWEAQPLASDNQDQISSGLRLSNEPQQQIVDILEPTYEFIKYKKLTQYQRIKQRLFISHLKQFNNPDKRLQTTKSSTKDSSCDSKNCKGNRKEENCHSIVQQFKLQLGQTVSRSKKTSRAVQIKNRNAQQVRKLEPSHIIRNECTNPSLMNEIQFETERAKKYLHLVNPTS